jgi:two-component system, NarL family, response regulator NreC
MSKIRVIIADDHAILLEGLKTLLELSDNIEVVGGAATGKEAIDLAAQLTPDVVLMDVAMPVMDGIEATRYITKNYPKVKVIILSQHDNREYIVSAIKAGASGYMLKKAVSSEIISGIEAVHNNGYFFYPSIAKIVIEDYLRQSKNIPAEDEYERLSERERQVLRLIAEGVTSSDIAQKLFISVKTVLGHRANIMEKLNLHSRTELVKYAIRKGIIQADS